MKRALLIAEKPSLMRTLQETYNSISGLDYKITKFTAQAGHLVRLLLPSELDETQKKWSWDNLPFYPEEHGGWKYRVIEGKEKLFSEIKKEINSGNYDFIIHAGDPDQEGQLLVQLVLNKCGNKLPVKRFWSNDLTPKAIEKGFRTLKDNDNDPFLINLYKAALTRQKVDYLFGMNFSQAISLKTGQTMPIGRVKTPVTKIIVDRENEIANFVPKTTYEVSVDYKDGFGGVLVDDGGNIAYDKKNEAVAKINDLGGIGTVASVDSKQEKTNPPAYFKLSTLQIAAGKAYGYNADKVLSLVQSLYEKKFMSYPRTSCEFLSSATDFKALLKSASVVPELVPFINKITDSDIKAISGNKRYCNDKKLQEAGHSALTLTEIPAKGLSVDEMNVYTMVAKQLVASFLPALVENKTVVMVNIDGNMFKSNGKVVVSKGFTELLTKKSDDKELPVLKEGQILKVERFHVNDKTTTCPSHYTDADVIALMENPSKFLIDKSLKDSLSTKLKIGTEATRATEIKDICGKTGYAEKRKGKGKGEFIHALPKSLGLIEQIKEFDITSVDMTAKLEYQLEQIKSGELDPDVFVKEIKQYVRDQVKIVKGGNIASVSTRRVIGKCPSCGGDIILGEKTVCCSNWKDGCRNGFPKTILGAKITDGDIEKLLEGKTINKTLKKDDKSWKQKLKLNENFGLDFVKEENIIENVECPVCGGSIKITDKFYLCENYKNPDCNFIISKECFGAKLTQTDVEKLLAGKRVKKKLKSKAGKDYDGFLIYKGGKVQVEFQ